MAATTFASARSFTHVPPPAPPAPPPVGASPTPSPVAPIAPGAPVAPGAGDDAHGPRAIEVAAMFGESVVGVTHCVNPRGGVVTRATWGFVAGGASALVAAAAAFASAVHTQAINAATYAHAAALHRPAWSVRPLEIGVGTSAVAFGGLTIAIAALATGLARMRREKQRPGYRIGTAPGVEHAIEGAPTADFALVAPAGDDFVFNFGAGIDGDLTVGGTTTPLAALVATGQARPSPAIAGALELAIPRSARIRARAGQTTFLVSSTAVPRATPAPLLRGLESRALKYVVGSLALHLGVWAVLQQIPVEDGGNEGDMSSLEVTGVHALSTSQDDAAKQREPETEMTAATAGGPGGGGAMALATGTAGAPDAIGGQGRTHVAARDHQPPQISRAQAIEEATTAGILGSTVALERSIGVLTGSGDISAGFDADSSINGLVDGTGFSRGSFGGGVSGTGPGGGCSGMDCHGIGTGRYATIGNGDHAGGNYGGAGGGGIPLKGRKSVLPPQLGEPTAVCGGGDCFDRAIIRRYIKRSIAKIQYCYEHELLGSPDLSGTVAVQFLVAPDGTVQSSVGSGMSPVVASCVAGVVKNIAFPRPNTGGAVQVNYPFSFRQAGH